MGDPRHDLGLAAEDAVARWLTGDGWTIRARRERRPGGGEVDLVAVDPIGALVAVEVRARRSARAGAAVQTVDAARVARIGRTLVAHARASGRTWQTLRVDLVTVEPIPGRARWVLRRVPGIDGW
jgi:putative endonuclease